MSAPDLFQEPERPALPSHEGPVTLDQMIACVAREVKLRQAVYPGQIARGRMSVQQSERETKHMGAVLDFLKAARETQNETEDDDLDEIPEEPRQLPRKERNR